MTPTNYRITWLAAGGLCIFAVIADLITLIPLVGTVVGPLYWIIVTIYLYTKGFGWINGKRLATSALSLIGELIPAIQALPLLLAGTVAIIILARIEDKTGFSLGVKKQNLSPQNIRALNQDGVRQPTPRQNVQSQRNQNIQPLIVDGIRAPQGK